MLWKAVEGEEERVEEQKSRGWGSRIICLMYDQG